MAASLFFRAASWYWIARAALPNRPVRRRDVTSATMIGVLMSATLPARLGEPARALALARRTGPHAGNLPGPARDPGLADDAQPRGPGAARGDHRLDHAALPLRHPEALRLQPGAAAPPGRRPDRPGADAAQRQRPPRPARRRRCTGRWSRSAPASRSSATRAAGPPPLPPSSAPGRSSSPPAGRCSTRSASTARPGSAPPPPSSSRSTSPRSCRRPRRTSASSSWP